MRVENSKCPRREKKGWREVINRIEGMRWWRGGGLREESVKEGGEYAEGLMQRMSRLEQKLLISGFICREAVAYSIPLAVGSTTHGCP